MKLKKILIIIIILAAAGLAGFWFRKDISVYYNKVDNQVADTLSDIAKITEEVKKEVITPPPLRASQNYSDSTLSRSGVINWTNTERSKNGLQALNENNRLNSSAQAKVNDMFTKQYFDHVSPSGRSVSDLADDTDYEYLIIGENLALGNFKDDNDLVQAWMNSPGHRANILNEKYRDIGVAVERGMYEGRMTWLAVQHFGRPASLCPKIDPILKQTLTEEDQKLDDMKTELNAEKQELENIRPKRGEVYNQKVEEYNALVEQYNNLLGIIKIITGEYNDQVNSYNNCISG